MILRLSFLKIGLLSMIFFVIIFGILVWIGLSLGINFFILVKLMWFVVLIKFWCVLVLLRVVVLYINVWVVMWKFMWCLKLWVFSFFWKGLVWWCFGYFWILNLIWWNWMMSINNFVSSMLNWVSKVYVRIDCNCMQYTSSLLEL